MFFWTFYMFGPSVIVIHMFFLLLRDHHSHIPKTRHTKQLQSLLCSIVTCLWQSLPIQRFWNMPCQTASVIVMFFLIVTRQSLACAVWSTEEQTCIIGRMNNCWWGWQNRTALEKCTHLYDGIIKHEHFQKRVFVGCKKRVRK